MLAGAVIKLVKISVTYRPRLLELGSVASKAEMVTCARWSDSTGTIAIYAEGAAPIECFEVYKDTQHCAYIVSGVGPVCVCADACWHR